MSEIVPRQDRRRSLNISEQSGQHWIESITSGRSHCCLDAPQGLDAYAAEWIGRYEDDKFARWRRSQRYRAMKDKYVRPKRLEGCKAKRFITGRLAPEQGALRSRKKMLRGQG